MLFSFLFVQSQKEQNWTFLACKFEISDDTEKTEPKFEPQFRGLKRKLQQGHQSEEILFSILGPPNRGFAKKMGVKETTSTFYMRPYPAVSLAIQRLKFIKTDPPTGRRANFRETRGLWVFFVAWDPFQPLSCGFVICSVIFKSQHSIPSESFLYYFHFLSYLENPNQSWNSISKCPISVEKLKIKLILVKPLPAWYKRQL